MMDQVGEACKDTPPVCAQAVHRDPPEPFWGSEISGASWLDSTPMTPGSPRGRSVALDKQALADRSAWDVLIRVSGRDRESCC